MDYQNTKNVINAIEGLVNGTNHLVKKYGLKPNNDSISLNELSLFENQLPLQTAYGQGHILVEVASDQIVAFTRTLQEPIQSIAPFSASRSVLESCALAIWLLDNEIDSMERIKRSYAFRYEGMIEQRKLRNCSDKVHQTDSINEKITQIIKSAINSGVNICKDKKGKITGIGHNMPSVTELSRKIGKESDYRLLSAVAHAHNFALLKTSFVKQDGSDNPDMVLLKRTLSPIYILHLCNLNCDVFDRAIKSLTKIHGRYNEEYEALFDKAKFELAKYYNLLNS